MANPGAATTITAHPQGLTSNQAIRLIAYAIGVSINATGDAAITLPVINTTSYNITNVIITDANKDVSAGALAIWTGPRAQAETTQPSSPCPQGNHGLKVPYLGGSPQGQRDYAPETWQG